MDSAIAFIYCLRDPVTLDIRYLGRTQNPKQRLQFHWNDRKRGHGNADKVLWLRSLDELGLRPLFDILDEVSSDQARECEQAWIEWLHGEGHPLTNRQSVPSQCLGKWQSASEEVNQQRIGDLIREAADDRWSFERLTEALGMTERMVRYHIKKEHFHLTTVIRPRRQS